MTDVASPPAFPMARKCPFNQPAEYADLRAGDPVSKVSLAGGRTAWVVTKHEHARQILLDTRVTSNQAHPGYPHLLPVPPEVIKYLVLPLVGQDPPVHTRHRRLLMQEFTVNRMQALRPRIQEIVDEHVDAMLAQGGPVDLVQELSLPVPSLVICELLGVPYADRSVFQTSTEIMVNVNTGAEERARVNQELINHLIKLVGAKSENPTDGDLLGRLLQKNAESQDLSMEELVGIIRLLLIAGHETTANMISLSVAALLENPEQLAEIKADPALTANAVDELLRFWSVSDRITTRAALADIEVGGVTIPAGDGILVLNGSANHDEAVFENPAELDIHREARPHVAFGYGPHQCIGQNLARIELEIMINTLFSRIPDLRLTKPSTELDFKHDGMIYGLHSLPVTW